MIIIRMIVIGIVKVITSNISFNNTIVSDSNPTNIDARH